MYCFRNDCSEAISAFVNKKLSHSKERWNGCYSRSTFFTSLCTCVLSDHRIFQQIVPVALSHCLTGTEGDTVYVITLKTPESTTKFRKVPETTGKPESQESVSVALSHFFRVDDFSFLRHKMRRISSVSTPR